MAVMWSRTRQISPIGWPVHHRTSACSWMGAALLLMGCPTASTPTTEPPPDPPPVEPGPEKHLFSLAIIADPHIAGQLDHEERLETAVEWINQEAIDRDIQLVLVLGDIGWGEGLARARELLDGLQPTWVPIIGDNVIQYGDEEGFEETFSDQFEHLSTTLEGWDRAATPVWHDATDDLAWLQNFVFDHRGVRFIGQDWNIRGLSGILAEFGDFNDVPGGSWEWLEAALVGAEKRAAESIVLLSHVPIAPFSFDVAEQERFADLIQPIGDWVYANFAGHLHLDYEEDFPDVGYATYVTDATWDDENVIRLVEVRGNAATTSYVHEVVEVSEADEPGGTKIR